MRFELRSAAGALALVALCGVTGSARAGVAPILELDTSVRSLGRGGASAAVFWDGGSEWVNPALLGYRDGLSFTWDRHDRVNDYADDIVLSSRRLSLGLWGVGFSTSGQPVDVIGGTDLDYGRRELTNPDGTVWAEVYRYEHVRSWSLGVSLATLVDHSAGLLGNASRISDWADLAVGGSWKLAELAYGPPETKSTFAADIGVLLRLSPLDTRRQAGAADVVTHRLDVAYGHAALNANDPTVKAGLFGSGIPTDRLDRDGGAVGWTIRFAPGQLERDARLRCLAGPDGTMLRVVAAFDHEAVEAFDALPWGNYDTYSYDVARWGTEIAFGRVAAFRTGHVSSRGEDILGFAWGFGLGAPLGPLGEASYDFASTPRAEGLEPRHSHSVTLRLDVLATLSSWRKAGPHAGSN